MLKVVQCWDDGVQWDIPLIEILRKHGAKASFNLNAATHKEQRHGEHKHKDVQLVQRLALAELPSVYEGFTIANHGLEHKHLSALSEDEARYEIRENRKRLQDIFQQPIEGFAYAYGDYDDQAMRLIEEEGHCYARTVKHVLPCMPPESPFAFHPTCKFNDPEFFQLYERAKTEGGVFYFWGHSYEMISPEMWADFEAKIQHITEDPESEWEELVALFK